MPKSEKSGATTPADDQVTVGGVAVRPAKTSHTRASKPKAANWKTAAQWRDVVQPPAWRHAAADALHGWTADAHQSGSYALHMTRAVYEAALECSSAPKDVGGGRYDYVPHPAACTPYAPSNLRSN